MKCKISQNFNSFFFFYPCIILQSSSLAPQTTKTSSKKPPTTFTMQALMRSLTLAPHLFFLPNWQLWSQRELWEMVQEAVFPVLFQVPLLQHPPSLLLTVSSFLSLPSSFIVSGRQWDGRSAESNMRQDWNIKIFMDTCSRPLHVPQPAHSRPSAYTSRYVHTLESNLANVSNPSV